VDERAGPVQGRGEACRVVSTARERLQVPAQRRRDAGRSEVDTLLTIGKFHKDTFALSIT
jgi:hypothetical protein